MALANDRSQGLPHFLSTLRRTLQGIARMDPSKLDAVIPPEKQKDHINAILAAIEERDPSPNKQYTPWLARMYTKSGGGVGIEDSGMVGDRPRRNCAQSGFSPSEDSILVEAGGNHSDARQSHSFLWTWEPRENA